MGTVRAQFCGPNHACAFADDEEKKARQGKRERDEALGARKDKGQGEPQVGAPTSTVSPASTLSPATTATSPGSPVDSANDCGASSSSAAYDYPDKGKWCRPRNALGRRFQHVAREELPWDMQLYWPLTVEERALLTQLTSSYQTVTSACSPEDQERMRQWDSFCMEKAIFALEHSMRQYVQFARVIPEFQALSQGDQISVLKASALQWYHIRTASYFIPERRYWANPFGVVEESELSGFFGDAHGLREYADFCEGLKFMVKNDTTLYALMHTLVLFDARDPNIENRVLVNNTKDKYMVLLKHYLESQFSFLHADRYLVEIMEQILDLQQLGQSSMSFYKHFSSHFRPLVAEVLSQ